MRFWPHPSADQYPCCISEANTESASQLESWEWVTVCHSDHLCLVMHRLKTTNLKLKPTKCIFARREVEHLRHIIEAEGLRPNPRIMKAVHNFPAPHNVQTIQRFLGIASYYRKFIAEFANIAHPLHHLTAKDTGFRNVRRSSLPEDWTSDTLMLAYPQFGQPFTIETDAYIMGLGAVLSQEKRVGKPHSVQGRNQGILNFMNWNSTLSWTSCLVT